jgi:hypothetical protein
VEWATGFGSAQDETTGAEFVIRIVFDDLARRDGLANLHYAYLTADRLIQSVTREFEFIAGKLRENVDHQCH